MNRRTFFSVSSSLAAGALASNCAQNSHDTSSAADGKFEAIAELIERKMDEYGVVGVAFGISKDGISRKRGFGITNIDNEQQVTTNTVFPIASISKTVVATAIMRLRDLGQIDVEAPVRAYLPKFKVKDENASKDVCIWHLLTHTPGWEGQLPTPDRGPKTLEEFTKGLGELPQLAKPGEVWSYNNAGFGVAGHVLEAITGNTIDEALKKLVFEPLGLVRAFTLTGEAMSHRFAFPHRDIDNGETSVVRPFKLHANVSAGGCAMTLDDLLHYAEFHLGDGTSESGQQVLTQESVLEMRTPRIRKQPTADAMGLGWHIRTLDGVLTAQHGGTLAGHCLHTQLIPERNLAFVILTNHREGWRLNQDVANVLLNTYEQLKLDPNQPTGGNRGGSERMTLHAEPLHTQPPLAEYTGRYIRPPVGEVLVTADDKHLTVESGGDPYQVTFWGKDLTYSLPPRAYTGMPVEFIRDASEQVNWIRVNGRIARKTAG